jgi:hypothetical protein
MSPHGSVFDRLRRNMAFRVEITRSAEADLEELYVWVVKRAPRPFSDRQSAGSSLWERTEAAAL